MIATVAFADMALSKPCREAVYDVMFRLHAQQITWCVVAIRFKEAAVIFGSVVRGNWLYECKQRNFRYGYNSGFHIPILPAMRVLWYLSDASIWYIDSLPAIALPTVKSSLSFDAHCEPAFACPQFCFTWNKGWVLTWSRGMIGNFNRNFSHESIVLSRSYITSKDRQGCISLVSESNWKTKIKWFFCQKAGGTKTGIAPPEAVGMKREDRVVASKIQRNYRYGDGYYFLES